MSDEKPPLPLDELRSAIGVAKGALQALMKDGLVSGPAHDIRLDSFALAGPDIRITLGYRVPSPFDGMLQSAVLPGMQLGPNAFKTFTVNRATGAISAMIDGQPKPGE